MAKLESDSNVVVKIESGVKSQEHLHAYVVSAAGKVTESAPFEGSTARLRSSNLSAKGSRLFVGPGFPADYPAAKIDVFSLAQANAYRVSAATEGKNEIVVQRIPSQLGVSPVEIWFCDVQGDVANTLTVNGVAQSGPVCKARVHICTVDWWFHLPIWLQPRIPESVIADLADAIAAHRAQSSNLRARARSATLRPISSQVEDEIRAATPETIRQVVFNRAEILLPHLCWWEIFWPWFYRVVEQAEVYTDCNGHFDAWLYGVGAPTTENIYVWVEASIGGSWVTVYNPPFPCNIYWNYACGTAIAISLDDAAIPPCSCQTTVPDGSVWFTAIGSLGIATNIQQDVTSSVLGIKNVGCTNLVDPYGNQLCPFGSTLGLYLAFGETLPPATHYLWTWTDLLDSSLNPVGGSPTPITGAVERYYVWELTDSSWENGAIPLLDTDADGNIAYQIPDFDVTSYPGVPADAEWTSFNFLSASLDSTKIANGHTIQLNLQLMNKNGAGVFEVVSAPVATFQVSVDTNAAAAYDGSTPAPYTASGSGDNYLALDPSTPGNALSLSLKVRIDNASVTAQINPVELVSTGGSTVTAGPCGMLESPPGDTPVSFDLSFVATEPFNFATFSYEVYRGSSGGVLGASGYVFQSASPFTLSGAVFSDSAPVGSLLGTCPAAAFSENLSVDSLATDGTGALWLDGGPYAASDVNAFALAPST
jgi:hypothetical protein